jgi:hypothetical protein
MQSSLVLFPPKKETVYLSLKTLFLQLLDETERRCRLTCHKAYDQERYSMVSYHPEIGEKANQIERSKARVLLEAGSMQDDQEEFFYHYTLGLCQLEFNSLFMTIFCGKLKKHWLPLAEEYNIPKSNMRLVG